MPFSIRRMMVAGRTFNRMAISATEIQAGEDVASILKLLSTLNDVAKTQRAQLLYEYMRLAKTEDVNVQ